MKCYRAARPAASRHSSAASTRRTLTALRCFRLGAALARSFPTQGRNAIRGNFRLFPGEIAHRAAMKIEFDPPRDFLRRNHVHAPGQWPAAIRRKSRSVEVSRRRVRTAGESGGNKRKASAAITAPATKAIAAL